MLRKAISGAPPRGTKKKAWQKRNAASSKGISGTPKHPSDILRTPIPTVRYDKVSQSILVSNTSSTAVAVPLPPLGKAIVAFRQRMKERFLAGVGAPTTRFYKSPAKSKGRQNCRPHIIYSLFHLSYKENYCQNKQHKCISRRPKKMGSSISAV